jgi:hypothetical protein
MVSVCWKMEGICEQQARCDKERAREPHETYLLCDLGGSWLLFLLCSRLADVVHVLTVPLSLGLEGNHSVNTLNSLLLLNHFLMFLVEIAL